MLAVLSGCALFERATQPLQATQAPAELGISHALLSGGSGYEYLLTSPQSPLESLRLVFDSEAADPPYLTAYNGSQVAEVNCYELTQYDVDDVFYVSRMCDFGDFPAGDEPLSVSFTGTDVAVTPYFSLPGEPQTYQLRPAFPE